MSKLPPIKLGIVGQPSSGKDTVASYLKDHYGFQHFSSGDLFRQYVKDNNLGEPTRPLLQKVANDLRKQYGADYAMRTALKSKADHLVVSGTRNVADVAALKEAGGKLIAIQVPLQERYERVVGRKRTGDNLSFEEFKNQQESEQSNPEPHSQNVGAVIEMADYTIENSGTLEELYKKIDDILIKISSSF